MAIITQEVCRHVLWFYGFDGGYQPGSFMESLLKTIKLADHANTSKLASVFPEYVAALELPIELLQAIARGEEGFDGDSGPVAQG